MRVVHIATAFPRSEADIITPWLVSLLAAQTEQGVTVEVLAPAYRGTRSGSSHGVRVRRFRYAPARLETLTHDETVPDRLARRPCYAALLPPYLAGGSLAAARLGSLRPDVVHVHWPMPHAWFGALVRAASGGHTAVVSSFYSVELRWVERRLPWLTPFLRWSIETSDGVTAISSATAERVRSLADRPVRVIPFAATLVPHTDCAVRPPLADDRRLELLFVGRLVERKGVETLVRALPRVLERAPVRLTVVGEGEWESVIREAVTRTGVEPHVRMTGRITADELERMYATADIFVLPAVVDRKGDTEGLGVVLLEAMQFGRPVIASDVGGIPDIVRHGQTGWLVEPGDAGRLAERILAVADDPSTSRRVAQQGREWVADRFDLARIASELIDCYREAIAARRGR